MSPIATCDRSPSGQNSIQIGSKSDDLGRLEEGATLEASTSRKRAPPIHVVIFLIKGCSELFYWNCILNILYDIRANVYPDYPSMTDTLNAVNNLSNILVCAWCIKSGAMNQKVVMGAGGLLALCCLATAFCVQWAKGMQGVIWLHVINFAAGAACGFFQTGGFGLASAVDVPCTGYVSTGQGICGVITFIIWIIISHTGLETKAALWILMAIGFLVIIFSTVAYWVLLQKPDVNARVEASQKALREEATNPNAPSYTFLFKKAWILMLTIWWNFAITLFFFPNVGPINWGEGDFTDITLGMFQIGDLIGRYLPNVLKFTVISAWPLLYSVMGRTLFIPLALLCWKYPTNGFWGSRVFHVILMLLMATTNGWSASCVFINTPHVIKTEEWRSRVTSMVVFLLTLGIATGLWTSRIFTALAV